MKSYALRSISFLFLIVFNILLITATDYNITTCQELQNISNDNSGNYFILNDINCSGVSFTPIGSYDITQFEGVLEGNGFSISNLAISEARDYVGLFGFGFNCVIRNLTLNNSQVSGLGYVGGIAGGLQSCNVSNVHALSSTISGDTMAEIYKYTGGLVGVSIGSTITSSSSRLNNISGYESVGGIVGVLNLGANVSKSYSASSVYASYQNAGGIVGGENQNSVTTISDCWTSGSVTAGDNSAGGIVADLTWGSIVNRCYSIATISAPTLAGGVVVWQDASYLYNSFFAGAISVMGDYGGGLIARNLLPVESLNNSWWTGSHNYAIGGAVGDEPKELLTTEGTNQADISYFNDSSNGFYDTWDFNVVWNIKEDKSVFPFLRWQDNSDYFFAPVVYLFPIENSTSLTRTIYYNVSDDSNVVNCSLYLNNVLSGTNTSINKSINNSFTNSSLSYSTDYNVSVYCIDEWGKGNYSNSETFSVGDEVITYSCSSSVTSIVYLMGILVPMMILALSYYFYKKGNIISMGVSLIIALAFGLVVMQMVGGVC